MRPVFSGFILFEQADALQLIWQKITFGSPFLKPPCLVRNTPLFLSVSSWTYPEYTDKCPGKIALAIKPDGTGNLADAPFRIFHQ